MIEEKTWEEFRDSKLLWWINRTLHLFGWSIVCEIDNGEIIRVYPAKCSFRGFDEGVESDGYAGLTNHIAQNIEEIKKDFEK